MPVPPARPREESTSGRRYEYGRWQFTNHSSDIQEMCTQVLDGLGVSWRRSNWHTISVSRREAVARLDELIGPKT